MVSKCALCSGVVHPNGSKSGRKQVNSSIKWWEHLVKALTLCELTVVGMTLTSKLMGHFSNPPVSCLQKNVQMSVL